LQNLKRKYSEKHVEIFTMFLKGATMEDVVCQCGVTVKQAYNIRFRIKQRFAEEVTVLRASYE